MNFRVVAEADRTIDGQEMPPTRAEAAARVNNWRLFILIHSGDGTQPGEMSKNWARQLTSAGYRGSRSVIRPAAGEGDRRYAAATACLPAPHQATTNQPVAGQVVAAASIDRLPCQTCAATAAITIPPPAKLDGDG